MNIKEMNIKDFKNIDNYYGYLDEDLNLKNIEKYLNFLDDEDFKNETIVKHLAKKIKALNTNNENGLICTDNKLIENFIYDGNLSIANERKTIYKNLIVTGNLWFKGTELVIEKNLIVGGNMYLCLNSVTTPQVYDISGSGTYCDKARFFIGGSLISIGENEIKTSFNCNFGKNSLTVLGETNISGNCHFYNGNCNFYDTVTIDNEAIIKSLLLCNCNEVNFNGDTVLKEINTIGNNSIIAKKNMSI